MGAGGGLQTGIQLGVTLSARAILARLHLAPRKHEDWKVVQFQSGTKERNEFCRMEEGRLAGLIAHQGSMRWQRVYIPKRMRN